MSESQAAPQGTDLLVVTATGREADEAAAALRSYLPDEAIAVMPAWETLPHERLSPRSDTVARRLAVLRRLAHPQQDGPRGPIRVLVVPVRALLAPVIAGLGELEPIYFPKQRCSDEQNACLQKQNSLLLASIPYTNHQPNSHTTVDILKGFFYLLHSSHLTVCHVF